MGGDGVREESREGKNARGIFHSLTMKESVVTTDMTLMLSSRGRS